MNERLKELIKQAGLDDEMFPLDDGWENPELITFAELIVRECIDIVKDVDKNPYLEDHHHAKQIIRNTTKRFGIQ